MSSLHRSPGHVIFLLVATLGASGSACGGAEGPRPPTEVEVIHPASSGGIDCAAIARLSKTAMVDDFEGGPPEMWSLPFGNPADAAAASQQADAPLLDVARCDSPHALHVHGGKFADYAKFERSLPDAPFDASQFTGVGAWLRKGDDATALDAIYLSVRDRKVDGTGSSMADKSLWGKEVCDSSPSADESTKCGDGYGASLGLRADWTFIKAPFAKMKQGTWGFQATIDPAALYSVGFEYYGTPDRPVSIDVWVDDLVFYAE